MWKNGFTVGEAQEEALTLRRFDEPQNVEFMESIKKGEIPQELQSQMRSGRVALDVEDHRDEDYKNGN